MRNEPILYNCKNHDLDNSMSSLDAVSEWTSGIFYPKVRNYSLCSFRGLILLGWMSFESF